MTKVTLEVGSIRGVARVYDHGGALLLPDWSLGQELELDPATWGALMPQPSSYDVLLVRECYSLLHAQYLNAKSNLRAHKGAFSGTVALVSSGPSAADVNAKLAPYRDQIKVATCNLASTFVDDPDFWFCVERLGPAENPERWYEHLDTQRTMGVFHPNVMGDAGEHWAGENCGYYMLNDTVAPEAFSEAPLLSGALHVGVTALHILAYLGFDRILLFGSDFSAAAPRACMPDDVGAMVSVFEQMESDTPEMAESLRDAINAAKGLAGRTERRSATFYANGMGTGESYINGHCSYLGEGIGGEEVLATAYQMRHMLAMKVQAQIAEDTGVRVYNCGGGGLLDLDNQHIGECRNHSIQEVLGASALTKVA